MLIEFSVENFRSFKERVTLSMVPVNDKSWKKKIDNSFEYTANKKLLKSVAIYGANAAGKSNILKALNYMKRLVLTSHLSQKGEPIATDPFRFDPEYINQPSTFDIQFVCEGIKYAYGFAIDRQKVLEEYLYYWPNDRQKTIFERTEDGYKFTSDKSKQMLISELTAHNILYLSNSHKLNSELVSKPYQWFRDLDIFGEWDNIYLEQYMLKPLYDDKNLFEDIKELLTVADLGIHSFKIDKKEHDDAVLSEIFAGELKELVKRTFGYELTTIHKVILDNQDHFAELDFMEESRGTRKFLGIIVPIIAALKLGQVIVIDELDVSFHTKLTEFFIELFHNPKLNQHNAQLIISTHDTNLLSNELFSRDQIWLVEKNAESGSSELYSLVELRIRNDEHFEKNYLRGRYGAIPFINWRDILDEK